MIREPMNVLRVQAEKHWRSKVLKGRRETRSSKFRHLKVPKETRCLVKARPSRGRGAWAPPTPAKCPVGS